MTLIDFWDILGDWLKRRSCLLERESKYFCVFLKGGTGRDFISFTENAKDKADVSFFY